MGSGNSVTETFQVLIIGAGIGGLCLAHGLRRAGIRVALFEREGSPIERAQGYRLSINPDGNQALHDCLSENLFQEFAAACATPTGAYRLVDEDLNDLFVFPRARHVDSVRRYRDICRAELRRVLLKDMDREIRFGKIFVRYSQASDGKVVASFADGSYAAGHLLVGADGAHSAVRKQLLPQGCHRDTGVLSIAGKVPLSANDRFRGPHNVLDSRGCFMFVADVRFAGQREDRSGCDAASSGYDYRDGYTQWTFSARRNRFRSPALLERMSAAELLDEVLDMTRGWHRRFRPLIEASDISNIRLWRHSRALPVTPWQAGNATLIGDAIHLMPPFAGMGANTALRDAALLCRQLAAARHKQTPVRAAVAAYEAEMRRYGFAAVDASMAEQDRLIPNTHARRVLTKASLRMSYVLQRLRETDLAGLIGR